MIDEDFIVIQMEALLAESRIPEMAVYGVKVGKIKLCWKNWAKYSWNMWNGVSLNYIVEMALFQMKFFIKK